MKSVVFVGPTLPLESDRARFSHICTFMPPARQGDVYLAALSKPPAIGVVDGIFESVPSIWHKEILWAMKQGIHVFGSASMGALRAAELEAFGMVGVGKIFEAYRDGNLEDDDEVAQLHGPANAGYTAVTVALVNIRSTLALAVEQNVMCPEVESWLLEIAKTLFYKRRSYEKILARAQTLLAQYSKKQPHNELEHSRLTRHCPGLIQHPEKMAAQLEALETWLPRNKRNQKRDDALQMLEVIKQVVRRRPGPKRVEYSFVYTHMWENLVSTTCKSHFRLDEYDLGVSKIDVLNELRLEGEIYVELSALMLARVLALESAERLGALPNDSSIQASANQFRRTNCLISPRAFSAWLAKNCLTEPEFLTRICDELTIEWVEQAYSYRIAEALIDYVRMTGRFAELAQRAQRKRNILRSKPDCAAVVSMSLQDVLTWYFTKRRQCDQPTDLDAYVRDMGFADIAEFEKVLRDEYVFSEIGTGNETGIVGRNSD